MSVDSTASRINPLVKAILRSPAHWLLSPGLMLITVTGRRTRRRYTIPVGYQRDGDLLTILVSEAPKKQWWRNFHEPAPAEVRVRGKTLQGTAVLIPPTSRNSVPKPNKPSAASPGWARFSAWNTSGENPSRTSN